MTDELRDALLAWAGARDLACLYGEGPDFEGHRLLEVIARLFPEVIIHARSAAGTRLCGAPDGGVVPGDTYADHLSVLRCKKCLGLVGSPQCVLRREVMAEAVRLVGRRMKPPPPFESDQEKGVYFWVHGGDPERGEPDVQLSTHRHPLLPHHCAKHKWWTDKGCPVCSLKRKARSGKVKAKAKRKARSRP